MFDLNTFCFDADKYDIFEGMTSISAVIKSILSGTSDRHIIAILYSERFSDKLSRDLIFLRSKSDILGFGIIPVEPDIVDGLTAGKTHGGIIAICTKRSFPSDFSAVLPGTSFYALIDGIEDPYNFAYSIRSLYASGVDGIVLPQRNWMEFSGTVARSSAGTSELVNMYVCDTVEAVKKFKDAGFKVVCASIRDSVSIYDCDFRTPVLLIAGGEKRGISRKLLDMSDVNIRINYGRDFMGSLPSASAISIIAFEIANQKSLLKK